MQYIGGLPKLRALHILHFRNTDTCMWVMREIRRFIVDNLSHHPESNLEFIAMEDEGVDRVVRTPPPDEDKLRRERRKKQALKDNRAALETTGLNIGGGLSHTAASSAYPVLPSITLDSDSDSDSEDDGSRLRFKTIGLMFYDVWGIKIFEKEVRGARL